MKFFKLKDDPVKIGANNPLEIIRVMKFRNPLDYDLPDKEFITRVQLRYKEQGLDLKIPDERNSSKDRAEVLMNQMIEFKLLEEVEAPDAV